MCNSLEEKGPGRKKMSPKMDGKTHQVSSNIYTDLVEITPFQDLNRKESEDSSGRQFSL